MTRLSIALALATLLVLPACSQVKEELGLNRNSPDEFTVIKRAPLSLPPEYSLRPLSEDGILGNSAQPTMREEAKTAVFGSKQGTTELPSGSNAEDIFLNKVGTNSADANIRKKLDQDNGYVVLENQSTVDKILRRNAGVKQESLVDPKAEAERLKENAETGRPVTSGAVPVIIKKESTIDKIFK